MEQIMVILNGSEQRFDAVVNMMDDEICEELHGEGIEDPQVFVDAYVTRHAQKYDGEHFGV